MIQVIWDHQTLSECLGVDIKPNISAAKIQINSVNIEPGDIFIALRGTNVDGHIYVANALENGASCCIVSRIPENFDNNDINRLIIVPDVTSALIKLALHKRNASHAKFIAVTGSVGKTSTKEAIYNALLPNSFCSRGNFNTYLGLHINLASMPNDIKYGVFEVGMSEANEIRPLSQILKPDIAVITTIAPAHIEFFDSIEGIADAKSEIFEGLSNARIAILPRDSQHYDRLKSNAQKSNASVFSFGKSIDADARLLSYKLANHIASIDFMLLGKKLHLQTSLLGEHQALNILTALLCVHQLGGDISLAMSNLSTMKAASGRGELLQINAFGKIFEVIDDAYNSSPASLKASLKHVSHIQNDKKIICIADMLELGSDSIKYHESLVDDVIAVNPKCVVVVGKFMKYLGEKLGSIGYKNVVYCNDYLMLKSQVDDIIQDGSLILFKGSKSTKLHEVIKYIKDNAI